MSHTLKHCGPTVGASMRSLLQLLTKGGVNYLVDGAIKRINFKLGLVAHSYQPDRFRGYLHRVGIVYNRPLIMDPWALTDILKVAAKMHPQLDSSLVSGQQRVSSHAQLCHVTLLLAIHLQSVASGPGVSLPHAACRSRSASIFLAATPGMCLLIQRLTQCMMLRRICLGFLISHGMTCKNQASRLKQWDPLTPSAIGFL